MEPIDLFAVLLTQQREDAVDTMPIDEPKALWDVLILVLEERDPIRGCRAIQESNKFLADAIRTCSEERIVEDDHPGHSIGERTRKAVVSVDWPHRIP